MSQHRCNPFNNPEVVTLLYHQLNLPKPVA
jgi:hypothetical protein